MGWEPLLNDLNRDRQQLDQQTAGLAAGDGYQIYCQSGCSNCCSLAVNCAFPEVVALAQTLTAAQRQQLNAKLPLLRQVSRQAPDFKGFLRLFRQQLGGCPFLDSESAACSIYPGRPLSCRALLSTRNSSWCAVDFAELHPQERDAFLSSLDPAVVAFPSHYLAAGQELGLAYEGALLASMREAFGFSLSGNFLYQLWLELELSLSEIIPQGFAVTRQFLEQRALDLPFLLQLREA
jgi:Fe-S-cluster containining protein